MPSALEGLRVIEFGQYIPGPLVGMLLADQGADVIKVERPGGDPARGWPGFATWNRGKRSIVLDLKRADDLERARSLVESADVVIENFRPGVMDRLDLGAEAMTAANPGLIYCSLPGFASDDPRADVPAWEGIVGAATATYRPSPTGPEPGRPVYTAVPIASTYAAFQAAVSIAMALNARERDGVGQHIEVPLFDSMFASIGARGLRVHNRPAPPRPAITWTRQFECRDGRWIQFHTGNKNFLDFIQAAGIASWEKEGLTDPQSLGQDPQLAAEQMQRIRELFKTRTAQEWEDLVSAAGCEAAICRTSAEWIAHPQARESRTVIEVDDPRLGRMLQPGINARLSRTPGAVRRPAPKLNAHGEEVLADLASRRPVASGAVEATLRSALEGVRVIDLTIILAGPTCGRTLAEFGAEVIKIDSPHRRGGIIFHNDINRAKRSLVVDLKTKAGLDVFWRLLEDADVVVQNFRKGVVEKLGIGYEQVRARRPDIVYASLNTYGQTGPWAGRPGHEQIAQAAAGMQERFGGDGPPVLQPNAANDYGTGFMGAYGVALALLHRRRTGEGQHVDTALAFTATTLQSPFMQDYEGKSWDEPRGQDALGSGPLHRAYSASDGWVFIGARQSDLHRLASVEGLADLAKLTGKTLAEALEERLPTATVSQWVERLTAAGVGAHRVVSDVRELMDDPWAQEHGLSLTRDHDELGPITTTGPAPRLSRTPVVPGRPAPKPGSDAPEVFAEAGLADQLDRLIEQQAVWVDGIAAR